MNIAAWLGSERNLGELGPQVRDLGLGTATKAMSRSHIYIYKHIYIYICTYKGYLRGHDEIDAYLREHDSTAMVVGSPFLGDSEHKHTYIYIYTHIHVKQS